LPIIIERSRVLGVEPLIGVRAKMNVKVSGHWNSTSGDRSVFGLTASQLIGVIDTLKREQMMHCLKLLHCHLGSQLPSIQEIRNGVVEACRYYADLVGEGAELSHIDLGGGLAVDYTGARCAVDQSRNYTLDEYCEGVVDTLQATLDEYQLPHPTIVTESGRATVAYSSVLLFNILETTSFEPAGIDAADEAEHELLTILREIADKLQPNRAQVCFNDAHFYRDEVRELFKRGQLDLRTRATAENVFLDILTRISKMLDDMERVPPELSDLKESLADIYYGNFSLFQSLPDIWAIDQMFPIMPVHRLAEKPDRLAMIADITCDCDGKIDRFIGDAEPSKTLAVHALRDGEE
jgi:arginine decarboxylase